MDPDRLVFPPVPAAMIVSVFYMLYSSILPFPIFCCFCSGKLFGYISYDMVHYYLHHGTPRPRSSFHYKKVYHHNHHFKDTDAGYGISTQLWDYVFKTTGTGAAIDHHRDISSTTITYSTERMYYFEGRRIFRQWLRSFQANKKQMTYAQYARLQLLVAFPLFYIGWNMIGGRMFTMAFWRYDDELGEERWFKPAEVKKIVSDARVAHDDQLQLLLGTPKNTRPPVEISKVQYPLDDVD